MACEQDFQILRISSSSNHSVRNSANEYIAGEHVLWENNGTFVDGDGSFAPHVYTYDFVSPLASNSTLRITLKVFNHELFGKDVLLRGLLNGAQVFQSQVLAVESPIEVIIAVYVVQPHSSPDPVSLMGDIAWELVPQEPNFSRDKITYVCPDKTRLELYCISQNIHEIFKPSGIAIDFLRSAFESALISGWDQVTQGVFSNYSKVYDTLVGRSHFGLTAVGGHFQYERYIARQTPTSNPGSKYPIVNCDDQAAMAQLLGTLRGRRPTWLVLEPFGFINDTHLVGVNGLCNNPFFQATDTPQHIDPRDRRRSYFSRHVFNGSLAEFSPDDRIYDACSGPHLGTNARAYLDLTIDRARASGGTVSKIRQCPGVSMSEWLG